MTDKTNVPSHPNSNWDQQKTKLKAKFPVLKDEDLKYDEGKREEMLTGLQTKLGKTKEELNTIIAAL